MDWPSSETKLARFLGKKPKTSTQDAWHEGLKLSWNGGTAGSGHLSKAGSSQSELFSGKTGAVLEQVRPQFGTLSGRAAVTRRSGAGRFIYTLIWFIPQALGTGWVGMSSSSQTERQAQLRLRNKQNHTN